MRSAYLETLYDLAKADSRVFAVISDNGAIVYDQYREDFPEQYINAGISEANMVAMAAGLANRGLIPFAYTIGAFLAYRAYEFILNDVCLQNQNVKLVGIGAGCSYSLLGSSHHAIFDLAALRPMPNLTIFSPASPLEVKKCVRAAYEMEGPAYIRLGTNREAEVYSGDYDFAVGKAVELRSGKDLTIISTGSIVKDALEIADELAGEGIEAGVLNLHTIKPFDGEAVAKAAAETPLVAVLEEHSVIGGLSGAVAETLAENGSAAKLLRLGFHGFAEGYGKHEEVKAANGLGVAAAVEKIKQML